MMLVPFDDSMEGNKHERPIVGYVGADPTSPLPFVYHAAGLICFKPMSKYNIISFSFFTSKREDEDKKTGPFRDLSAAPHPNLIQPEIQSWKMTRGAEDETGGRRVDSLELVGIHLLLVFGCSHRE